MLWTYFCIDFVSSKIKFRSRRFFANLFHVFLKMQQDRMSIIKLENRYMSSSIDTQRSIVDHKNSIVDHQRSIVANRSLIVFHKSSKSQAIGERMQFDSFRVSCSSKASASISRRRDSIWFVACCSRNTDRS